ncbi:PP2Cc [Musa troglodytarum]|uniref:protein-serine/threonine phosphatase n=1 Tax=Musa troglodytarum TaxID=320322 RepID=A0A9E7ELG6_9LILI|nr:PP2Cc [Musa troglodytarum]
MDITMTDQSASPPQPHTHKHNPPTGDDRRLGSDLGAVLDPSRRSQRLMAAACLGMAGEGDTPEKCRGVRRRRIETRHLVSAAEGASPPSSRRTGKRQEAFQESEPLEGQTPGNEAPLPTPPANSSLVTTSSSSPSTMSASGREPGLPETASSSRLAPAVVEPSVAYGTISLTGRSREMEDAVSVWPGFFRPEGSGPLHFFAVFDGHGGYHVAALCKDWMHVLLAEELGREMAAGTEEEEEMARTRAAVGRGFARMDELALAACACGKIGLPPCGCERSGIESEIVGSTAVVALVSVDRVVVANCGDSRAVLSRGGQAVPLSSDHKPDRPDELARIEAAGGRVIYLNGARVHGMLAMSRALGLISPAISSSCFEPIGKYVCTETCMK